MNPINEKKLKPFQPIGKRPIDWIDGIIYFISGALFGAFVGWYFHIRFSLSYDLLEFVLVSALLFGLIVLIFGDSFWRLVESIFQLFREIFFWRI